jgi:hypothetical protein
VRGLAKGKASADELAAACSGIPDAAALQAGRSGRSADALAAFQSFQAEVAQLALDRAPAGQVLAACDR